MTQELKKFMIWLIQEKLFDEGFSVDNIIARYKKETKTHPVGGDEDLKGIQDAFFDVIQKQINEAQ